MTSPGRSDTSRGEKGETRKPDAWAAWSESAFAEDWNSVLDIDHDDGKRADHLSWSMDVQDPTSGAKD